MATPFISSVNDVLNYEFDQKVKVFFAFLLVTVSIIYLFYWKKNIEEKTPFYSVTIIRIMLTALSFVSIGFFPMMFTSFSPNVDSNFYAVFFAIYAVMIGLYIVLINIDILRYGIPVMLKKGGLDIGDEDAKLAYDKIFKGEKNRRK